MARKLFGTDGVRGIAGEFVSAEQQSGTPKLWINDPFSATRTVNIRGFGDFESRIDTIFVDLTYYDDVNDYKQTHSTALTKGTTFNDWDFSVISEKDGKLTYSANIRFKDGTVETIPPTVADSDTIMLGDVLLSRDVTVMADLIDFAAVKLVKVSLHYVDEANGLDQADDLVFKKAEPGPKNWAQSYKDKKKLGYQWSAQYFFADGKTAKTPLQDTVEETIVLPERPA